MLAISEVRAIKKVLVYDIVKSRAQQYSREMAKRFSAEITPITDLKEAIAKADIIVTATTATSPVLNGDWLSPGTHINAIGWMGPNARELDTKTIVKAKLVVDSKEAVLSESGDILIPIKEGAIDEKHIYAELGEIIIGKKLGRVSDSEITLWESVGLAVQDAATAKLVYEKAVKKGVGIEVNLGY